VLKNEVQSHQPEPHRGGLMLAAIAIIFFA